MTASPARPPSPEPDAAGAALPAGPIPAALHASAGSRLVSALAGDADAAGRRFVAAAPDHGIDLHLLRGTIAPGGPRVPARVRQCCLPVPGAGRTAMLFISTPGDPRTCGDPATQHAERVGSIRAALAGLGEGPEPPRLAQALPEPEETSMIHALEGAGFVRVGTLDYLARPFPRAGELAPTALPEDIDAVPASTLGEALDETLMRVLERTYVDTRDCPTLCGLRETRDVLDSHRATGDHNPDHWLIVRREGEPVGCVLLSHTRASATLELVYLGLAPEVRGRGLSGPLMRLALRRLARLRVEEITCAVDGDNAPAVRLYANLGFRRVGRRAAYVRSLR